MSHCFVTTRTAFPLQIVRRLNLVGWESQVWSQNTAHFLNI